VKRTNGLYKLIIGITCNMNPPAGARFYRVPFLNRITRKDSFGS